MKLFEKKLIKAEKIKRYSKKDVAEKYDVERFSSPIGKIRDAVEQSIVQKNTQGLVLDAGCGTGRFSIELAKKGFDVIGIDSSKEMLRLTLLKKNENYINNLQVINGDLQTLPFKDNSFDTLTCVRVLFHMPFYKDAIKEFVRVLKPSGKIILEFDNGNAAVMENRLVKRIYTSNVYNIIIKISNKLFSLITKKKYGAGTPNQVAYDPAYHYINKVPFNESKAVLTELGMKFLERYTYDFPNSIWCKNRLLRGGGIVNVLLSFPFIFSFVRFLEFRVVKYLPPSVTGRYIIIAKKPLTGS